MTLGEWIGAQIVKPSDLARACGVSATEVGRWKNTHIVPAERHWPTIEDFLGLKRGEIARRAKRLGYEAPSMRRGGIEPRFVVVALRAIDALLDVEIERSDGLPAGLEAAAAQVASALSELQERGVHL